MWGVGVGIVLAAVFGLYWPGWYMSKSTADAKLAAIADTIHTEYCLASYLGSGVTAKAAIELRSKSNSDQVTAFLNGGHAQNEAMAQICGKGLDRLSNDEATMTAAIKKATEAAAARTARMAAAAKPK